MDEIDVQILKLLKTNARMRVKTISSIVMLSEPSVKNRISKMKESGVIDGFHVDVNYEKLGYMIDFFMKITEIKISFSDFEKRIQQFSDFQEYYSVTGTEKFIIKGHTKDIVSLNEVIMKMERIAEFNTSIVLKTMKMDDL
ncbi:Lrp/AsnC family transcriptional regulator [Staphylococcus intermedius]|uniref:AsnC family transcriptional regulator n=1 Tax=Staphylococcus intermedius NCTC 11048 TaxID=1141106 RepID=A0A380G6J7_STAIN|nr:Lrp/AsnC family transcriptional regulator [Staphylococcus intermedius]PCF64089.1 AsnC family transcriptional regulator [Staphylococcus intermedius]PCF78805.1 AsnC family transcriptional regulator [Staphylococcus intermedius]PCF79777.1 AsnC family transcriptional regulator [Staphylococcus intermedius]PCF85873.1 AsnC family transcriptional regulator [Staphylococcus intermedius]PCF89564.1 AsnC family transcriptional regulator [Staphylococcus intermedius]